MSSSKSTNCGEAAYSNTSQLNYWTYPFTEKMEFYSCSRMIKLSLFLISSLESSMRSKKGHMLTILSFLSSARARSSYG